MPPDDDLILALTGVATAFSKLQVPYFVGGSVASSYHGAMRSTMDVDVVAELENQHVDELVSDLGDAYYANRSAIEASIRSTSCFNLIHLATSFKVDVFVSQRRPFDQSAKQRAHLVFLGMSDESEGLKVPLATTEDIILAKLEWFRLGNEASERQWDDLTRMYSANRATLDRDYLLQQANTLGVADLLNRIPIVDRSRQ